MPGPLSAHQGHRSDPAGPKDGPHGRCQQRERCNGPGCRVRTGKTHAKRTGALSAKDSANLAHIVEEQENAA